MVMSSSLLATQLLSLVPVATEAEAISVLADAYAVFAAGATAGAVPMAAPGVSLGKAAMLSALAGMSSPDAGASVLASAATAFWSAVAGGLATSFPGATAIVPPPHAALQTLLDSTFASNVASTTLQAAAVNAVAVDFYGQAIVGGSVTFPGPVVSPIT